MISSVRPIRLWRVVESVADDGNLVEARYAGLARLRRYPDEASEQHRLAVGDDIELLTCRSEIVGVNAPRALLLDSLIS